MLYVILLLRAGFAPDFQLVGQLRGLFLADHSEIWIVWTVCLQSCSSNVYSDMRFLFLSLYRMDMDVRLY